MRLARRLPESPVAGLYVPATNREPRRGGGVPDLLLLHYTGMRSAADALAWLTSSLSRVSCHYLIDEAGAVTQMVPESERAWHAGEGSWAGCDDINSCSIGLEVHNPGHSLSGVDYRDFPAPQMRAVAALSLDICRRWRIRPGRVLAHSDTAPARKSDPGERFDWGWLHVQGVGHWVEPEPLGDDAGLGPGAFGPAVTAVQQRLGTYGYGLPVTGCYDLATEQVVRAFQRHWRQARVDGRFDSSTSATLARLAAALAPASPLGARPGARGELS
jgi:N-acetylmuramoyl-L-alanine amidase